MASLLAFSGPIPPQPLPYRATYAAAKAFQVTFTQALAAELAGTGVQVQACCPGLIDTEFHALAGRDLAAFQPLPDNLKTISGPEQPPRHARRPAPDRAPRNIVQVRHEASGEREAG
jgi:short-subunit dehydrogenase